MANPENIELRPLLSDATTVAAGTSIASARGTKTYQAFGTTTAGAGASTIQVQGTMDGISYDLIGTISLTLSTTTASDGFTSSDHYQSVRGNITAISGTGASVSLFMGC